MKNPSALITVDELITLQQANNKIIILDCTIDKVNQSMDREHVELIPNSLFFDIEGTFSAHESGLPHTMVSPQIFSEQVQQLGINQGDTIILYDRWGVYSSPRVWWMFRYMGHQQVYVLNGGLPGWKEANQPVSSSRLRPSNKGNFVAQPLSDWFINHNELKTLLHKEDVSIVDARAAGRFDGRVAEPRAGVRSGHIPSSSNIPFDHIIDGYHLKERKELETIYSKHVNPSKRNIFTCGSGITASILALGAYELELPQITVYDGSWAEWGADAALPIATNDTPIV